MPIQSLSHLLELLRSDADHDYDAVEAQDDAAEMDRCRDRIDALDRVIIALLNERAGYANRIGKIKKRLSIPVYVPAREDEVLANVIRANGGPLSDEAVKRLYERIIDETRSLERHVYQEREHGELPIKGL